MAEPVRYGILGAARIARNQHIPAAAGSEGSVIHAIASRSAEKAKAWANEFGFPRAYGSYDELLADPDVEAVINPLPNALHAEWTVKAAEAGKHILCEKPLAVTVEEARSMFAAAKVNGVLLMEGFMYRFHPQQEFVRKVLDSGEIGEVRVVRAELVYTIQDWAEDVRANAEMAGGAMMDAGCYTVHASRTMMACEPVAVQALQRIRQPNGVDSTFVGIMEFPGDRYAHVTTGMEQPFRACCEVVGSKGRIEMSNLFAGPEVVVTVGGERRVEKFDAPRAHQLQIEHFSRCVRGEAEPLVTKADSLGNTAAVAALKRAAETGEKVRPEKA